MNYCIYDIYIGLLSKSIFVILINLSTIFVYKYYVIIIVFISVEDFVLYPNKKDMLGESLVKPKMDLSSLVKRDSGTNICAVFDDKKTQFL